MSLRGISPHNSLWFAGKINQQDVLYSSRLPLIQHVTGQWLYDDNVNITVTKIGFCNTDAICLL